MPRSGRSITGCPKAWRSSPARSSLRRSARASCSASRGKPSGCRPTKCPTARLRPLAGVVDVPPIAAPLRRLCRMDGGLLSRAARLGAAHGAAVIGRARRPAPADRISADRASARPADAAAREGARRARTAGRARSASSPTTPRSATRVLRGLVNAGALEAVAVDADRPLRVPRPRLRAARPQRRPARGRGQPRRRDRQRASIRSCSTESPARARPKSISKRSPNACARAARRSSCCPRSR